MYLKSLIYMEFFFKEMICYEFNKFTKIYKHLT